MSHERYISNNIFKKSSTYSVYQETYYHLGVSKITDVLVLKGEHWYHFDEVIKYNRIDNNIRSVHFERLINQCEDYFGVKKESIDTEIKDLSNIKIEIDKSSQENILKIYIETINKIQKEEISKRNIIKNIGKLEILLELNSDKRID